jgi:NhaP-type Na+/H+ or K+/H+ antiporter
MSACGPEPVSGWRRTTAAPCVGARRSRTARSFVAAWEHLMTFWRLVEEILNASLFLAIGLEIAAIDLDLRSVIAMAAMIPTVLVIRWLSVTASAGSAPSRACRIPTPE